MHSEGALPPYQRMVRPARWLTYNVEVPGSRYNEIAPMFPTGAFLLVALAPSPSTDLAPYQDGPVRRVSTEDPAVAITFDACATKAQGNGFDRAIFDIVRREGIPVTIFVSGRWVDFHPDVMEELAADAQIEFGDHSYDHPHMSTLPRERIAQQIDQAEAALARYGKKSVAFRPPFGEWSPHLLQVMRNLHLTTVTWDIASGDPSEGTTARRMIRDVVGKSRPGSIIIFHINGRGWKTAEALPSILKGLRARGFHFVSLSDLLALGPRPALALEHPSVLPRSGRGQERIATIVGRAVVHPIITENPYQVMENSVDSDRPRPIDGLPARAFDASEVVIPAR